MKWSKEMTKALDELFAGREVNGDQKVTHYKLRNAQIGYRIVPVTPYWEEAYHDPETDKLIKEIGKRHNIHLAWEHWVYHK